MSGARLKLLAHAALCYEQAGQPQQAAQCREDAGQPIAAAELYAAAGDWGRAASCYQRAGRTRDAASCLILLGRPEDAAELFFDTEELSGPQARLEAAWIFAGYAGQVRRARQCLAAIEHGTVPELRLRLATGMCAALEGRPEALTRTLTQVDEQFGTVPGSERAILLRWAVQAADQLRRPDLGAQMFATAYRARVRGCAAQWGTWARAALGGTAGVPERDL